MATRRTRYVRLALCLVSALLIARNAEAQIANGSIRGQVTDSNGSAITTAHVAVTGPDGKVTAADTTRDGNYEVKNLPPGKYGVSITAKGFAPFEALDLDVALGPPLKLDVSLSVEIQKEQVLVESNTPTVDVSPETNAGAIVMTDKDLEALSDDPDELQNDLEALAGPSAGPNGGQIYIDGFTGGQLPPKSAIREIRINQNPFSSEYDRLGYGRIEIFTKPGMDQFHGSFEMQGNDSAFNSRNPFSTIEPGYESTQFGGNLGGPVSKKASFFFSWQYRDINDVNIVNAQTLDANFNPIPFSDSLANPRRRLNIGPRIDIQLTPTNTLNIRYQFVRDEQTNLGVGGFNLASLAFSTLEREQQLQISDTQVFGSKIVNETRFQFIHEPLTQTPASLAPVVIVPGAFTMGGSSAGTIRQIPDRYEFQNYTQMALKKHTVKFGARLREFIDDTRSTSGFNGTFLFSSLSAYQITQKGLANGLTIAQIQSMGGGAAQFSQAAGLPEVRDSLFDAGLYIGDDWKVRPNVTLSGGLRFETQTGIGDHADWAPRLAVAWGIGHEKGGPKTVLRAGAGIFYDRFTEGLIQNAKRFSGSNELQCVIPSPDFFPAIPAGTCTPSSAGLTSTVYRIASNLHAPGVLQTAVVVERQLTKTMNMSLTYLNARGFDQLLANNINTPLPGTYNPAVPTSGVRPFGNVGNIYEYESEGVFRQQQFLAQFNIRMGAKFSLFTNYVLNYAKSDSNGPGSFQTNPFNLSQDYGRAAFDIRNRFFLGGSYSLPYGFRFSPFVIVNSGQPYSITLSRDLIGSAQFNQRPSFATAASPALAVVSTPFGNFDTTPQLGETLAPINSLTGPTRFTMTLRVTKTWGFGERPERAGAAAAGGGGGGGDRGGGGERGGGGPRGGGGGGPMGGFGGFGGGGASTNKRYNLTLGVYGRNLFNYTNVANLSGVLNPPDPAVPASPGSISPFFGRGNQLATGPYSTNGASRLFYLTLGFTF